VLEASVELGLDFNLRFKELDFPNSRNQVGRGFCAVTTFVLAGLNMLRVEEAPDSPDSPRLVSDNAWYIYED